MVLEIVINIGEEEANYKVLGKKYILKFKPNGSIYTAIMKFRYLEDYKKMKKLNKMLDKIYVIIEGIKTFPYFSDVEFRDEMMGAYGKEMKKELNKLKDYVEDCNFFNVDYSDGIVYENKFCKIMQLLESDERVCSLELNK